MRLMIAAALALTLPAAALAQSESHVNATSGALAGRSPHHAYRPVIATAACSAMHTIPSGKLPVYGATTLTRPGCDDASRIAAAAGASAVQAAR